MKVRGTQVSVNPSGLAVVTGTDVQAALAELDAAVDGIGGGSYTDEQVRDVIAAALVAGSNVTITPNDGADTITIAAAGGGGGGGGSGAPVYWWVNTSSTSSGAVPASDAPVPSMTLTIPGSATARTALFSCLFICDGHANRFAVALDGTLVTVTSGMSSVVNDTGKNHLVISDLPVAIPGDSTDHDITLVWNAQGSLAAVNMLHRAMVATVYDGTSSPL